MLAPVIVQTLGRGIEVTLKARPNSTVDSSSGRTKGGMARSLTPCESSTSERTAV